MYVSDLDGTLLNKDNKLSQYGLNALNELILRHMSFTYATARSFVSASVATSGLHLNLPIIAYNGAFIFEPNGNVLSSEVFSEEDKQDVSFYLNERGTFPLVYAFIDGKEKVSWMKGRENEGMQRYLSQRQGDHRMTPLTDTDYLYRGDVFYFTCIGEKDELQPIYDRFKEDSHYNCTLQQELYRKEYWCEIMPKAATKANAILKLKELGYYDKIITFGDAINDIPMFRISDECYAVDNAVEELKEIATGIIDSNQQDGVVRWLLKIHL